MKKETNKKISHNDIFINNNGAYLINKSKYRILRKKLLYKEFKNNRKAVIAIILMSIFWLLIACVLFFLSNVFFKVVFILALFFYILLRNRINRKFKIINKISAMIDEATEGIKKDYGELFISILYNGNKMISKKEIIHDYYLAKKYDDDFYHRLIFIKDSIITFFSVAIAIYFSIIQTFALENMVLFVAILFIYSFFVILTNYFVNKFFNIFDYDIFIISKQYEIFIANDFNVNNYCDFVKSYGNH